MPAKPKTDAQRQLAAELARIHEDRLYGQIYQRIRTGVWKAPLPERQFRFLPGRDFRADLAFMGPPVPLRRGLIVEVDGEGHKDPRTGAWVPGGHHRTKGRAADLERDALAMMSGWQVLRCTPQQVKDEDAVRWIGELLGVEP